MSETSTQIVIDLGSEWTEEGDGSIASAIIDRAASRLLKRDGKDMSALRDRIAQIRDEEIREHVRPVVAAALGESVQRFNEYGSPKGDPITLRDLILEKGMEQFKIRSGGYANKSPLEKFISEEIERQFKNELGQAMQQARAQVLAAVREQGALIVQETIERMARK